MYFNKMRKTVLFIVVLFLFSGCSPDYKEEVAEILAEKRAQLSTAWQDPRADCPTEQVQSGSSSEDETGDANWMLIIGIVVGVLFVALAIGLMMRRGGANDVFQTQAAWNQDTLPIHDSVANSMYGGAAPIFQQQMPQPIAAPAPQPVAAPVPQPVIAGPPLPPGGLPAGWSMEQWQYYGQQYLDQMQQ